MSRALPILCAIVCIALPCAPAFATTPFTLYMAPLPDGSDGNDGLTPQTAVNTLDRVEALIQFHHPTIDVEVRIKQGTYVARNKVWRTYVPGHTISFLPIDYQIGQGGSSIAGRPVFENAQTCSGYCDSVWFQARLPTASTDPLYNGGTSGLRFYYLKVQRYPSGGISIYGDSERDVADQTYSPPLQKRATAGLNGNTFFGMLFSQLGTKWANNPGYQGFGAIILENSSQNRIENNTFTAIENVSGQYQPLIHGLYVTHFSSDNTAIRNTFSYISGDPVKVRDRSNYNVFEQNTFTRSGYAAFYTDEFCEATCAIQNAIPRQCASYGNAFIGNHLLSDYDNDDSTETWLLSPAGLQYPGASPCTIPAGEQRLHTNGNTDT